MAKKISCRKNIKLFNRYLKERGLFTEFWREAKRQEDERLHMPTFVYLKKYNNLPPEEFIMDLICWTKCRLMNNFWHYEYDFTRNTLHTIGRKNINEKLSYLPKAKI